MLDHLFADRTSQPSMMPGTRGPYARIMISTFLAF